MEWRLVFLPGSERDESGRWTKHDQITLPGCFLQDNVCWPRGSTMMPQRQEWGAQIAQPRRRPTARRMALSLESCTGTNSYPRPHPLPWTWNLFPTIPIQTPPHPHPLPHKLFPSPSPLPYIPDRPRRCPNSVQQGVSFL